MLIQEDYFKNIFNTVREGILILDENLRVLLANRSFFTIFKVDSEETIGSLLYDLGNRQWNIPSLRVLLEEILPKNTTVDDFEIEHNFESIGQKTMLLNAYKIIEKKKDLRIILLAIEDITERREIEKGLEKTRKELEVTKISEDEAREYSESIINTVREPLIALDHDLRVVTASRSFYGVFKVTPEETVGQLIYDLGNKQWNIPKLRELLETILPQKATFDNYEVEHEFSTIGRRIMLLNARQIKRVSGKERIILLAIEDITERRKMEKESKDYEERFRRLFETSKDGLLLIDKRTGDIVNVNPAIVEMLGYFSEEFIGKKLKDIGLLKDIEDFKETIGELIQAGFINYEDVFAETKQGQLINVDIHLVDRARFIQCNVRDITERKQAQDALKKAHGELELRGEERHNANIALRVLLKQREDDKNELEEKILSNVRDLIMPLIDELKKSGLSPKYRSYLGLLESNLLEIISPFSIKLSSKYANLTNREILVADFIKEGKGTKEIAGILDVSKGTIDAYRNNIRKKLGLNKTKTNLRTYLSSII